MVDETLRFPKDVRVNKIILKSDNGTEIDIYNFFTEINIYENMFSNVLSGDIFIIDSLNLLAQVPIIGQEKLEITYFTPILDKERTLEFNIYKVSDRVLMRDRCQSYALHFMSKEGIVNLTKKVSRSYTGLSHNIVEKLVHNELESEKNIFFEESVNNQKIVVPTWSPLKTINWLSKRSSNGLNASYFFYEDFDGFHFKTFNKIIGDSVAKCKYYYGPTNHRDQGEGKQGYRKIGLDQYNIETYALKEGRNIASQIKSGLYSGKLVTYDLTKKQTNNYELNYHDYHSKITHVDDYLLRPNKTDLDGINVSEIPDSNYNYKVISSNQYPSIEDNQFPHDHVLQRDSELSSIGNTRLQIVVPGDSSRRIGDIVDVVLPSPQPQFEENVLDKYISGRYMVTAIRHLIQKDKYTMQLELVKDSYKTKVPESVATGSNTKEA